MSTGFKNLEAQISKHGGTASSRVTEPCIAAEHCMLNTVGLDVGQEEGREYLCFSFWFSVVNDSFENLRVSTSSALLEKGWSAWTYPYICSGLKPLQELQYWTAVLEI